MGSLVGLAVADAWCDLHWSHFTFYYTAAGHQASSAAAELASLHLSLLLPLAANGAPAVRAALLRLGAAAFLLREFSLEAQLLSAEQLQAELAASEAQTAITCGSDSDIETSSNNNDGCSSMDEEQLAEEAGLAAVVEAASGQLATAAARGGVSREMRAGSAVMLQDTATRFFFTGDLNEDLDRLLALEDATGQEITLDGLGYDDEAKQLMARFDQDKQAAAATAAALDKTIAAIADTATRFFFTGDLNEDLDRLLALEDATGQEITLDGLGYDDEAKQPTPPVSPVSRRRQHSA
ncbi:protein kinase domain-containing protein [Haematococcus lacustris]|uniref:Protein kinase domain-containing protein n=1 Tax=Haematococcus lacustris TaxID=44745 RepID=A0A699Z188_HAELA|nr:protein kinase domain-containing protein [Haematococcus lacustris]